jgi:hypothetical protein
VARIMGNRSARRTLVRRPEEKRQLKEQGLDGR